jgi:hypothetical protein
MNEDLQDDPLRAAYIAPVLLVLIMLAAGTLHLVFQIARAVGARAEIATMGEPLELTATPPSVAIDQPGISGAALRDPRLATFDQVRP